MAAGNSDSAPTDYGSLAWLIVALLFPVALLNYLDRQMLAAMKTSMITDIPGIETKENWGLVLGVFKWVYAGLSPFGGYVADRISRRHVICLSLLVWSLVTWLTADVRTFEQLLLMRALMGISEAFYIPAALANSVTIAQRCNLSLTLGKPQLPDFPTPIMPDGQPQPMDEFFRQLSHEGLEERLVHLFPKEEERNAQRPHYVERLDFEINTILKMGFPGYFLIVQDFINWAKNNGCPVGPGRGSGAGSLVAYVLLITDLDPLQIGRAHV